MRNIIILTIGLCLLATMPLSSQEAEVSKGQENYNVAGHGKIALIPNENMKKWSYDGEYHFSPAVRAGDFVYASGAVAGAFRAETPIGKEDFKQSILRAFKQLEAALEAGGANLNQVVKMRTFHVFDSKWITIPKAEQVKAVAEVRVTLMQEPHPAWTAVGTTDLLPDRGLVEIEVVAYAPVEAPGR